MKKTDMDSLLSRRDFFKKAAKRILPILAVGTIPSLLTSCDKDNYDLEQALNGGGGSSGCTSCANGSYYNGGSGCSSCANGSYNNGGGSCSSCANGSYNNGGGCTGCGNGCQYICGRSCHTGCYNTCDNDCSIGCYGTCKTGSKYDKSCRICYNGCYGGCVRGCSNSCGNTCKKGSALDPD